MAIEPGRENDWSCLIGCAPEDSRVVVRLFQAGDAAGLSDYFHRLSDRSRYDRFLGAVTPPSAGQLAALASDDCALQMLIAERSENGRRAIVGEARYVPGRNGERAEFALSVADDCRRMGIGTALLASIQKQAAFAGTSIIFGDTLRSNDRMIAFAKQRGFAFTHPPGDWKLVRFQKQPVFPVWILPSLAVAGAVAG